jgi:uncharacterized metal-binding protein YceD (DUF177 family)
MSEQKHYIIDLKRLPVGTHQFDIQLDSDFFASVEKSEILDGSVSCQATLQLREEDYQLSIAVRGTVFVVCDRCLDPMALEIEDEQIIESLDEMENGQLTMDKLDLSWLAYEIVSINIPLVHCHQAGGCNPQMDLLLHNHLCTSEEPEDN